MQELKKHITIKKDTSTGDDLDYQFLRSKGLEYIEKLSGDIWTDYNAHDPGVTILEMLSYAITDLAARIEMPMKNLLTPEDDSGAGIKDQFFSASKILTTNAVSETDYRKLFIDIEGVKNCWLQVYNKKVWADCKNSRLTYNKKDLKSVHEAYRKDFNMRGLYSVLVDFDDFDIEELEHIDEKKERINEEKERIKAEIRKLYHSNRNLCEDLIEIKEVKTHPIAVCADIELHPQADEELVHAYVIHEIDKYFSPSLKFYSLKQMKERGYTSEEIFEGSLLRNGFIDTEELEAAGLRTEVRLSDLIHLIMGIEGVKLIKDISIKNCNMPDDKGDEWIICIGEGRKPVRCIDSAYSYYKNVLPVNINKEDVQEHLINIKEKELEEQENAKIGMEIKTPKGVFINAGETTTIQNDFPDTYGIGSSGLPSEVEITRKSKAKQLKTYLLFFDQVLSSYFAHLAKVKDVLSVNSNLKSTYFTQAVKDIENFDELVKSYSSDDDDTLTETLLSKLDNNIERKNVITDHLLARFAETFTEYAFLMKRLYGNYAGEAVLKSKQRMLSDYDITGRSRGSALNYYQQSPENLWNTENVAGVQKRIARLSGIRDYSHRDLSSSFTEIYDIIDSNGKKVYRWRIYDRDDNIILSATENYSTRQQAREEVYHSMMKIVETSPDFIKKAFGTVVPDEAVVGNFEIQISDSGRYSFNVLDPDADPNSTNWVISRQFSYYDTQDEIKEAILNIIAFMVDVYSEEGMYLVEHILLRPDVTDDSAPLDQFMNICADDCTGCNPIDPYSFRVTVVLPGWTYRFANADFRNFLEELIRKELPAHVLARICWIGYRSGEAPDEENDMLRFEKAYRDFLLSRTNSGQKQHGDELKELIAALNGLNSVYPTGRLIDCDDEDEKLEGRIILGRTNIGNI